MPALSSTKTPPISSPSAGIHVSPMVLGAMSIGRTGEREGLGMNKESSFKLLDAYYDMGGNLSTLPTYNQSSEEFIGEWAEQRGLRDQLIITAKYSFCYVKADNTIRQKVHYTGNSVKSMHLSIEASLKKLVEEVMNGLHTLVQQGKVLYLGISDSPAWIVSKCNQYARDHGKTQFVVYQSAWNVMSRDFEREIIPIARTEGMALAPWDVLASGRLRTDAEEERRRQTGEKGRLLFVPDWERTPLEREMSLTLEKVAKEVEYLEANIDALRIALTPEHIKYLEGIVPFDVEFPHNFIGDGTDHPVMLKDSAYLEKQPGLAPIKLSD